MHPCMCLFYRFQFLKKHFGKCVVNVHSQTRAKFSGSARVVNDLSVSEFVDEWEDRRLIGSEDESLLYLKDWNFVQDCENDYKAYECPPLFTDDWLNGGMDDKYKFGMFFVFIKTNYYGTVELSSI